MCFFGTLSANRATAGYVNSHLTKNTQLSQIACSVLHCKTGHVIDKLSTHNEQRLYSFYLFMDEWKYCFCCPVIFIGFVLALCL